jgi:ribA/ribD-fused uncharacterized protein
MPRPIRFFSRTDAYSELSNFSPYGFEEDGVRWPTVEHYFQAQKFIGDACAEHRERIRTAASPKHAKTLGQSRKHPIRPDWDSVKEDVMRHALRRKFERPELRALLLGTKNRPLVESSPHDRYWGAGKDGSGRNRLGALLMELRTELRKRGKSGR